MHTPGHRGLKQDARMLIFGANGFLGSHVRRRAAAAGLVVTTASRSEAPPETDHHRIDLSLASSASVATLLDTTLPDVIVNCVGAVCGDVWAMTDANIVAVRTLLRAMVDARVPARLVHLGSAAEYGFSEPGVPAAEWVLPRPVGAYGATKLVGTRLVELCRSSGVDAVVLRVFNPLGLGASEASLPGKLVTGIRRALAGDGEVVVGPLDSVRDFVDARDVADAVLAAATAPALSNAVVNVGSGWGVSGRLLLKELRSVTGFSGIVREDAPGSARSSEVPWQEADIRRARRDLHWTPRRDLTSTLSDWWEESGWWEGVR